MSYFQVLTIDHLYHQPRGRRIHAHDDRAKWAKFEDELYEIRRWLNRWCQMSELTSRGGEFQGHGVELRSFSRFSPMQWAVLRALSCQLTQNSHLFVVHLSIFQINLRQSSKKHAEFHLLCLSPLGDSVHDKENIGFLFNRIDAPTTVYSVVSHCDVL